MINYRQADLADNPTFYNGNRLIWHATGITRIRRHRWPVEVYHEEGKAEGLDQYQLRDFCAIQRHVALVNPRQVRFVLPRPRSLASKSGPVQPFGYSIFKVQKSSYNWV